MERCCDRLEKSGCKIASFVKLILQVIDDQDKIDEDTGWLSLGFGIVSVI